MGLEVGVFRICEFTSSIPLSNSVSIARIRNLSDGKRRPSSASVRNGKLQFALCSSKPTTRESKNQDLFGELGLDSSEKIGGEIVEVKEKKSEEEEGGGGGGVGLVEKVRFRGTKQVMRRSNLVAKQVISIQSAFSLGFISQLWVDATSWVVLVVEVRPNLLSGESERFLLEHVSQVGDVVLIDDEIVMENTCKMVGLDTLVGYKVVTPGQKNIGKVRGYTFNINSGVVESLELDSFGISIIPSSLVSTYTLLVEDVVEVVYDTVVVHEAAALHIQRLTKGLWDNQNARTLIDELDEYPDFDRSGRVDHGRSRRRSFRSKKPCPKTRDVEDDWELPRDYL